MPIISILHRFSLGSIMISSSGFLSSHFPQEVIAMVLSWLLTVPTTMNKCKPMFQIELKGWKVPARCRANKRFSPHGEMGQNLLACYQDRKLSNSLIRRRHLKSKRE